MKENTLIPYARQWVDEEDRKAVEKSLKQPLITRGPLVEAFEEAICQEVGCRFALFFSSGSTALWAALQAASVGPNDLTFTTPNTFIATAGAAARLFSKLHLVDIDAYGNIDLEKLLPELQKPRSRGRHIILPVHFAGTAVDMKRLSNALSFPDTVIIEDAAHALGSSYPTGEKVGSCQYSDMTVFSFHPVKNITTGEGGMVTTNDEKLYERLKRLRHSGIDREHLQNRGAPEPWYYEVPELSCNYHATEMQAALGLSQLQKLSQFKKRKDALLSSYREKLSHVPGITLPPPEGDERTHRHLFPIYVAFQAFEMTRTLFMQELQKRGIGSQYHYVPLYKHPALKPFLSQREEEFPQMENHYQKAISIPFFSAMKEHDVERVVAAISEVLFPS